MYRSFDMWCIQILDKLYILHRIELWFIKRYTYIYNHVYEKHDKIVNNITNIDYNNSQYQQYTVWFQHQRTETIPPLGALNFYIFWQNMRNSFDLYFNDGGFVGHEFLLTGESVMTLFYTYIYVVPAKII